MRANLPTSAVTEAIRKAHGFRPATASSELNGEERAFYVLYGLRLRVHWLPRPAMALPIAALLDTDSRCGLCCTSNFLEPNPADTLPLGEGDMQLGLYSRIFILRSLGGGDILLCGPGHRPLREGGK